LIVRRNGKPLVSGNSNEQPIKGGFEGGRSKRVSGLEVHALQSAGAYAVTRENSTLRGQRRDEFWRMLRAGHTPAEPGAPFVWNKFLALLPGAGLLARELPGGKLRLGPMTDRELDARGAIEVAHGGTVHPSTLEPEPGGLFDVGLVGSSKWGRITLDEPLPNPAFEKQVAHLLGLTRAKLRAVLAGELDLDEARGQRRGK